MLFEPYVHFCVFIRVRVAQSPPVGGRLLARLAVCFLST